MVVGVSNEGFSRLLLREINRWPSGAEIGATTLSHMVKRPQKRGWPLSEE
jgi:hypothetical protein